MFESPIDDFLTAAPKDGLGSRMHFLKHGERLSLANLYGEAARFCAR